MLNFKNITKKIAAACTIGVLCFGCTETDENPFGDNTVAGLKEALNVGVGTAVSSLSSPGGYLNSNVKILLPNEAQNALNIYSTIKSSAIGSQILNQLAPEINETFLVELINSAATDAAPQAAGIFVGAISGMTISDGQNILFGENNAATTYLESKTKTDIQKAFKPSITTSLESVTIGNSSWTPMRAWEQLASVNNALEPIVTIYNLLPLSSKVSYSQMDTNLSDYVTGKALDGLFTKVADQEFKIRTDINSRTSDLLRDVFGRLDNR
jgi:hypothetical protein